MEAEVAAAVQSACAAVLADPSLEIAEVQRSVEPNWTSVGISRSDVIQRIEACVEVEIESAFGASGEKTPERRYIEALEADGINVSTLKRQADMIAIGQRLCSSFAVLTDAVPNVDPDVETMSVMVRNSVEHAAEVIGDLWGNDEIGLGFAIGLAGHAATHLCPEWQDAYERAYPR